eukprot:Rmarinus@m.23936
MVEAETTEITSEIGPSRIVDDESELKDRYQLDFDPTPSEAEIEERCNYLRSLRPIKLDVGGCRFSTSLATLTRFPDSMLACMFSGRHPLQREDDGSFFIDRDGTQFRFILNYLRDLGKGYPLLPKDELARRELEREADFYNLRGLVELLRPNCMWCRCKFDPEMPREICQRFHPGKWGIAVRPASGSGFAHLLPPGRTESATTHRQVLRANPSQRGMWSCCQAQEVNAPGCLVRFHEVGSTVDPSPTPTGVTTPPNAED